jgi:hypothetical protein
MAALHLKPDELFRVSETARSQLLTLEDMTEAELHQVKQTFSRIAESPAGVSHTTPDSLDDAGHVVARQPIPAGSGCASPRGFPVIVPKVIAFST